MKKLNKKGFTIVELVIVIGVIGILSAILIPTFVNLTSQAKDKQIQSNLRNAYAAYVAEAVDREIEHDAWTGTPDRSQVKKVAISYLEQTAVAIKLDDVNYYFDATETVWKSGATLGASVVEAAKYYDAETAGNDLAVSLSTFNGAVVYAKA